jgi:hypothetical protein
MALSPKTRRNLRRIRKGAAATGRGIAATNRGRKKVVPGIKKGWSWLGEDRFCRECRNYVQVRDWDNHVDAHKLVDGKRPNKMQGGIDGRDLQPQKAGTPETRSSQRAPNPDKERERERRRNGSPPLDPNQIRKNAQKQQKKQKDVEGRSADSWQKNWEKKVANGEVAMNGPSKALANGAKAWGDEVPATRADMEAHLKGGTAALRVLGESIRNFGQQAVVAQQLHPAIVGPINDCADQVMDSRMLLTRAYVVLTQVYRSRIEHEEQQGPKPEDKFLKDGQGG